MNRQQVFESKLALRRSLAARPIAEKLRLLDALREREVALRHSRPAGRQPAALLREDPNVGRIDLAN